MLRIIVAVHTVVQEVMKMDQVIKAAVAAKVIQVPEGLVEVVVTAQVVTGEILRQTIMTDKIDQVP